MRELRRNAGWTQSATAQRLGTTQQTYARWEAGKAEPNVGMLQAIADLFIISVDALVGRSPLVQQRPLLPSSDTGDEEFWGHVGLQLLGGSETRWYAISYAAAERIRRVLPKLSKPAWLGFETLSNQRVLVRTDRIAHFCLLDDGEDAPFKPFTDTSAFNAYAGLPPEVYRLLAVWAEAGMSAFEAMQCGNGDVFHNHARRIISQNDYTGDPNKLLALLKNSTLILVDGTILNYRIAHQQITDLLYLEGETSDRILEATLHDGSPELYYPSSALQLIELPIVELEDAENIP